MLKRRSKIRFHFEYIPTVEVRNHLKELKPNKATVPHDFPLNIIRGCADCLAQPLSYIINFFSTGIFPSEWKIMKVVPFYKGGENDKFENYRPISILPVMAKITGGGGGSAQKAFRSFEQTESAHKNNNLDFAKTHPPNLLLLSLLMIVGNR